MSNKQRNEAGGVSLDESQAKSIAKLLNDNAQRLSMRTIKQLEVGREKAVQRHEQRIGGHVNADGSLSSALGWFGHHRVTFVGLVVLTIICSMLLLQNLQSNESSDAFLLSAELPPEAFVDLGFEPSLNQQASL